MYSPLNEMIDRAGNRKVAQSIKAKAKRTKALHDEVLSLVHAANETALPERHVTPRAVLIVASRAMNELSSLSDESRRHGVLREVTKFISLSQKTFLASGSMKHVDLLPKGHPLSPLNASLSDTDLRKKYAEWIAADPAIADEARPLVAMAHSLPPESIEREHAFLRLRAMRASAVPAYFKIDDVTALVAAFSSGNSSAARRARVALQWRDRFGRWVEMGRGINFRFRLPDGSIQVGRGNYVGAGGDTRVERTASGTSLVSDSGLIEVSGIPGVRPGLYVINSDNAAVYKARIPGYAAPEEPSFKDQFDENIPSLEELSATRKEAPIGWTNKGAYYVSDDNYAVVPRNGQPYSVLRLDANGRPTGEAIARVRDWAEVNEAIEKDQPEFDKEIARLEEKATEGQLPLGRIPGATAEDVISAQDLLKMQEQRAKENKAFDEAQPTAPELGNKDLNGNPVPEGWVRDADNDENYTRQMPLRDGGTYPVIARLGGDGKYYAGHSGGWIPEPGTDGRGPMRKFDTLDAVNTDGLPDFIDYLNGTFTKDNPIIKEETSTSKEDLSQEETIKKIKDLEMEISGLMERTAMVPAQEDNEPLLAEARELRKELDSLQKNLTSESKRFLNRRVEENVLRDLNNERVEALFDLELAGLSDEVAQQIKDLESESDTLMAQANFAPAGEEMESLLKQVREIHKKIDALKENIEYPEELEAAKQNLENIQNKIQAVENDGVSALDNFTDEPPAPPSGGTPPKTPSPNVPSAPELFKDFDAPSGAFQLRTTEYEPEGRVDEKSSDFTDDPRRLATKFTLNDLVTAFTEALIGRPDDNAMQDILNANVDENDDLPDLADLADVVESNVPRATANNASGAGALEFNAGEEYVQAEALYNAVYEAGGDPNRVIANAYDAVNGNRNNAQKLLDAQGGVSSPEDVQLIEDITDEIRQIKDAAPDDEISTVNKRTNPEEKFVGSLIENVPVDYNNPDYFDMDTDAYIPSVPEIDENGYTDNPEILALDYESADLIFQMVEGITDGSGVALLDFSDGEKYMEGVHEVPVEALRDALQLQDINTNDILFKLRDESNDMSDDPGDLEDMIDNLEDPESPAKPSGMPEQISNQKIKDKNGGEFELNLIKIDDVYEGALINKDNGRIQIVVRDKNLQEAKRTLREAGEYIKQAANGDESMDDGFIPNLDNVVQAPQTRNLQAHSQMIKDLIEQTGVTIDDEKADQIRDAIDQENMLDWSEADDAEIIQAITEVAGTSIFGQVPTPAAERALPPTTGQRQAPVDSADKPRDPSVDAPSARPVRESSEGFSPFSDATDMLDDNVDNMVVELLDRSSNAIVEFFSTRVNGLSFLAFNSRNGEIAVRTPDEKNFVVKSNGVVTDLTMDTSTADSFFAETGSAFGWEPVPQEVMDAIVAESIRRYPDAVQEPAPAAPEGAPETPAEPAAPVPVFAYPGPREAGYTTNNTTLASDGSIIGAGSIVIANRDGKRGVVVSIQNDPEYARIRFEDGKIAVRSANQIKAVSNPDGTLAMLPSGAAQPSAALPSTDVESRLETPARPATSIARPASAWGVNDTSEVPDFIQPLVQEGVRQSDFSAWGERDAEIANAAVSRASLDSLIAAASKYEAARENGEEASVLRALKEEASKILSDVYGGRDGVSFGVDGYKVNVISAFNGVNSRSQADGRTTKTYSFSIGFYLQDKRGQRVGEGSRSIVVEDSTDENGNPVRNSSVKNDILKVFGANKKKGFASAYNRYMENWYIANGIDKVKVYAAGGGSWQGAFVWALNGFDWESAETARGLVRSLGIAARTQEEKAIAKKLAEKIDAANGDINKVPTPLEVALAGWYPGAKKWFGKDVIIERSWNGVKHLNPTAREQLQAVNYNQIKNAERRIQAGQNKPGTSAVGLAQVMDNSFQTNNPDLGAYIDQIRDALKNNRPLAFLSPAAKSALGKYVSKELLNKDSNIPLEDLFRLRTALASEYRAENDYANPFGAIGDSLADFKLEDFYRNSDALQAAGFSSTSLLGDDSGVNDTFRVTHKASGQVFFVKEEKLSRSWNSARGLTSEVEANTIMNALEMMGVPSVRGSREDKDIIIMSRAGATLPLADVAQNASTMFNYGITDASGSTYTSDNTGSFVDVLKNPEDVINMAIVDMLGAGQDRHDANWMAAFDSTDNRLFMFPIDNSLLTVDKNSSGVEDFFLGVWKDAGDVYTNAMPRFIRSAGEARAAEIFMNQVRKLITNLDNPLFQPKGEELAALIDKWGTYDAFKDALKTRLTTIVTQGSSENNALINSMKMSYWR
jgi:hypothetical protein